MYVPDDMTLGNPGIFGFIGNAITTVVKAVTGQTPPIKVTIGPPATAIAPTKPATVLPAGFGLPAGGMSPVQTIALIGGALLLGTLISGRGRGRGR